MEETTSKHTKKEEMHFELELSNILMLYARTILEIPYIQAFIYCDLMLHYRDNRTAALYDAPIHRHMDGHPLTHVTYDFHHGFFMTWFLNNLFSAFLLPPFNLLLLGAGGVILLKSRPRLGKRIIIISFSLLYLLATPFISGRLIQLLETKPAITFDQHEAEAIIILGAGTYFNAPEYGGDTVNCFALERLRYGARLYERTGKPVLVSGGNPAGGEAEGRLMKEALEHDFKVPVKWVEDRSDNTFENAKFSYQVLRAAGITRIYLVTHAWHMPRAVAAFEKAGFIVTPAPTGFNTTRAISILDFLPRAPALVNSYLAIHEWLGIIWYQLPKLS